MIRLRADLGINKIRQKWLRITAPEDGVPMIPVYIMDRGRRRPFKVIFREDEILLYPDSGLEKIE